MLGGVGGGEKEKSYTSQIFTELKSRINISIGILWVWLPKCLLLCSYILAKIQVIQYGKGKFNCINSNRMKHYKLNKFKTNVNPGGRCKYVHRFANIFYHIIGSLDTRLQLTKLFSLFSSWWDECDPLKGRSYHLQQNFISHSVVFGALFLKGRWSRALNIFNVEGFVKSKGVKVTNHK